jgi:cytidylate kinase
VVALDGPAGAGKSTVARRLSDALGFVLLDTGAIYRTVALAASRSEVAWTDEDAVSRLAARIASPGVLELSSRGEGTQVLLDGQDVSTAIRTPENSRGASAVSAIPGVRAALLSLQRVYAERGGVVMEGRDIGTVVAPDAEAKFFVTASPEVRAQRRYDELRARGADVTFEATLAEVVARDEADEGRAVAPLKPAADAEIVDTSTLSIDDVVAHLVERVRGLAPR